MTQQTRTACLGALLTATAACAFAQQEASVTPYRPSVSTPAALSAPGWLEVEAGLIRENGPGPSRRDALPYTLKLAFSEDWGIRLGGEALVSQRDTTGARLRGGGDMGFVLKRRFEVNDRSAFGLEGGFSIPTGRTGISGEKTDYSVNGIYSADIGRWHTDINMALTRIGMVGAGESRRQLLWAASLSTALNDKWGVVGELSGTHQGGAGNTSNVLGAVSYNVSKSLTLDMGVARNIRSGPANWSVFAGFTVLAARLF